MLNFFKINKKEINIYCNAHELQINDVKIVFPTTLETLEKALGKVEREEKTATSRFYFWDSLGLSTSSASRDYILSLSLQTQSVKNLPFATKKNFSGKLYANGYEINPNKFSSVTGELSVTPRQREIDFSPFGCLFSFNFDYEIPEDKYEIKIPNEEVISFVDLNFKLSIIQILMYEKELLKPKFEIYEFCKWYKKREINIEDEQFDLIPEVMEYFKNLPIPKRLANEITEIYQDGGNEIYLNTCLECEGYEEFWDIESIEDVKHFPNLKKAMLCYAKTEVLDAFNNIGIEAKWL